MAEISQENRSEIKSGIISRVNNSIWKRVSKDLPTDIREQAALSIRSFREQEKVSVLKDKPAYKKILDNAGMPFKELVLTGRLTSMVLGNVLSRYERGSRIGEFFLKVPIQTQVAEEMMRAIDIGSDNQRELTQIASRYNLDSQELSTVAHPDFIKRIRNALALNGVIYTWPRYILGYSAFAALLSAEGFKNYVISTPTETTIASASILLAGAIARARIDYAVLRDRNMSPDISETFFALLRGRIDDKFQLKANSRWGLLGAPLDIGLSSLAPGYSLAWFVHLPYSVPAYLLAMYIDQVVLAGTNVLWGTSVKIKERIKDHGKKTN